MVIAAIPAYNEENYISLVVDKTKQYVDQVIVIDDGSIDSTAEIAKKSGAIVLRHEKNKGKGEALNTALRFAKKLEVGVLIFLDGDGQHDPNEIPKIIRPILEGRADLVIGSRYLVKNKIPKYRMIGQKILNAVTNISSGIKVSDSQSGFRGLSQKAIHYFEFHEKGLAVESEMQFLVKRNGLKLIEVPISTDYSNGLKRNPFIHGLEVLLRIISLSVRFYLEYPKRL